MLNLRLAQMPWMPRAWQTDASNFFENGSSPWEGSGPAAIDGLGRSAHCLARDENQEAATAGRHGPGSASPAPLWRLLTKLFEQRKLALGISALALLLVNLPEEVVRFRILRVEFGGLAQVF